MKKLFNVLKYVLFLAIGIVLFYYVYRGLGVEKIAAELHNLNWGWVWLSFVFAIMSHLSRAIRWNMLIEPLGAKPRLINTFYSVMIMYASNLVITRSGELARCTVLSKYEKIPFGKLVGTVVTERAMDTLLLLVLVLITILSQFGVFMEFIDKNPEIGDKISFLFNYWFWIAAFAIGIAGIVFIWKYRYLLRRIGIVNKLFDLLYNFFEGIKSVKNLKNPWLFVGHSLFIYIMYFLMLFVVFKSYAPTVNVPIAAGLTTFIMGGLAMLAPVQGGIGAWHFMVIETLALYGIDKVDGQIFALISHTSMNVFILALGLLCFITMPLINRKKVVAKE